MLAECKAYAETRGHADRVIFHGEANHDLVRTSLSRAQIFVQHSVTAPNGDAEGLPTAIQEAMASGCVIVSTRHAGIPEAVVEGENGFLVAEHDQAGYEAALERCLTGAADLAAMSARSRDLALERFDKATLLKKTEDLIRSLV